MKVLVTGASGFAGQHLMDHLNTATVSTLVGTTLSKTGNAFIKLDLLNYTEVKAALKKIKPDVIYHLAAFSSTALSFEHPQASLGNTLVMQINLYEACLELKLQPRFLIVSSGQIYGKTDHPPITEQSPVDFNSPYSVSKVGQENLAAYYSKRGFESIIARPFNHIGPGQQTGFLVSDLASQIAQAEKSGNDTIAVGNLDSKRDFTDVRDIVRAYALLARHGQADEIYNVCSGKSISGNQILEGLLALTKAKIKVESDPSRMRPSDIPDLYGDSSKLRQATGWKPEFSLERTLADVLDYWRSR